MLGSQGRPLGEGDSQIDTWERRKSMSNNMIQIMLQNMIQAAYREWQGSKGAREDVETPFRRLL